MTEVSSPFVSIIIVNYNGESVLRGCLTSVLAQNYVPFEVVVVDNASSDASRDLLAREFPGVRVLALKANRGFAGGNNEGVHQCRGDLVVLLNNDTIVQPGWLEGLVTAAGPADVGMVASLVRTEGIPDRYYERNGSINILCHNIMGVFSREENLFYAGGASLLFKKNLLGLPFEEEYFAYAEDVYLGLRARFKGLKVVHTNSSVVHHLGGVTARKVRPAFVTFLQERNRILTILLFFGWGTILRALPYFVVNVIAKSLLAIRGRRFTLGALARAYWWLGTHGRWILRKRTLLRGEMRVPDADVLSWMTGKLTHGESAAGRLVNGIALAYCRLVRLRTIESLPRGTR